MNKVTQRIGRDFALCPNTGNPIPLPFTVRAVPEKLKKDPAQVVMSPDKFLLLSDEPRLKEKTPSVVNAKDPRVTELQYEVERLSTENDALSATVGWLRRSVLEIFAAAREMDNIETKRAGKA